MKKIIIAILGLATFLVSGFAFANSVTWNTYSNDCKTVSIANHETREGFGDPCWPGTSISANPGQSINVRIYYHNTGTATATNTRIVLNAPTMDTATQVHTFTGQVISDQGSSSSFTVSANLPSPQKLSFGTTKWYTENTKKTETPLLYNQNAGAVINGGLNIGSINSGWSTQGSVVVSFRVNDPQPTGTITAANPTCQIPAGSSSCNVSFTWSTQNPVGTSTVVRGGGSVVATANSGTQSFSIPFGGALFKLFNNNKELDSASATGVCAENTNWDSATSKCLAPAPDCDLKTFTATPNSSAPQDPVTLSWSSNNCTSVSISGVASSLAPNGTRTVWPTITTDYTLTGFGLSSLRPTLTALVTVGGPAGAPTFPAGAPTFGA